VRLAAFRLPSSSLLSSPCQRPGISPGPDLAQYDDESRFAADVSLLANKLVAFAEMGCRHVTLFLEDMPAASQLARTKAPPQKGQQRLTVGLMHAKLANDLSKRFVIFKY
jgi:hypothetical protein